MTTQVNAQIVQMYRDGATLGEICAQLRVSRATVTRVRRAAGLPDRQINWARLDPRMVEMAKKPGMTYAAVAEAVGVPRGLVARRMRHIGHPLSTQVYLDKITEDQETIMRGLYRWSTNDALARLLGWGVNTVHRVAQHLGLKKDPYLANARIGQRNRSHKPGKLHASGQYVKTGLGSRDWMTVNRWLWQQAGHPPPPAGHVVALKPRYADTPPDKRTADMLEVLSNAEHVARNSISKYPRELRDAIITLNKIKRSIK